jgi:hypothetical protein
MGANASGLVCCDEVRRPERSNKSDSYTAKGKSQVHDDEDQRICSPLITGWNEFVTRTNIPSSVANDPESSTKIWRIPKNPSDHAIPMYSTRGIINVLQKLF